MREELETTLSTLITPYAECVVELIDKPNGLFRSELDAMAAASPKRLAEFAAGRRCARRAILRLGGPVASICRHPTGEPIWPEGYRGSIAHDGRFAIAIAYRKADSPDLLSVDIVDQNISHFGGLMDLIITPTDRANFRMSPDDNLLCALIFSAKEAAIKILLPIVGELIDFTELNVFQAAGGLTVVHLQRSISIFVTFRTVNQTIISFGKLVRGIC